MKKILIIEDTDSIREEISAILKFENFQVIEAEFTSELKQSGQLNIFSISSYPYF